ncbi:MAG: hypothetical protein V1917_04105, partial [Candidatus Gottesmanbacteria bacterium]
MIRRFFASWWPLLVLLALEGILFFTNFTPNTYVVGWDNMFPEFNFSLNIIRTLSSVWQEYRGLGVMDGMSHAANLVHYLFLWLLSFVLPQHLLRYVYIFFTHLAGGVGMYVLLKYFLSPKKNYQILALTGALIYQYCFATIQMYYLPFEVFITHFAALPWLVFTVLQFLNRPTKRNAFLFAGVSLLSTPQAHVPTVFVVYLMVLTVLLIGNMIASHMKAWKTSIIILCITFFTNAFWGLPFAYATLHGSQTITESKNNQVATEDIFQKNRAFGDLTSVAFMNSFSLQYMQYDYTTKTVNFMLLPWITHNAAPIVGICGWTLFGIAILGLIGALKTNSYQWRTAAIFYLLTVFFIGNDIPGIRQATDFLRQHIPLFADIFRFVFTKFFILLALATALMAVKGIMTLSELISKKRPQVVYIIVSFLTICIVGITTIPSFTGNFFFKNLRVTIPKEYMDVFSFFQTKPTDERVLIYPSPWYWAWTQYRWGVIGSGFTWFGIPQPTIDRAFDPWSDKNENIYWELTQATYESDAPRFRAILAKYDIEWILFDEHIIHAVNDKALYLSEFETIVSSLPDIQKEAQFGRISLYHVGTPTSSITLVSNIKNIGPAYTFTDRDEAALTTLPYITDTTKPYDIYYPFRSLFTGRDQEERAFTVTESARTLFLGSLITTPLNTDTVVFDSAVTDIFSQPPRSCDILRKEYLAREHMTEHTKAFERFTSKTASNCIDIFLPYISHRNGYLLAVETRHITGRRLSISVTNKDTKRTFLETFVTANNTPNNTWKTSYFTIPPMNSYGLGYTITFDNLAIGREKSMNDISRIRMIQIPYEQMVTTSINTHPEKSTPSYLSITSLTHPNPSYYKVVINKQQ